METRSPLSTDQRGLAAGFASLSVPLKCLLSAFGLAVCYYLGARFGLALSFGPNHIAALWPPNALLLTWLLLAPTRHWWVYLLAVVPAEFAADLAVGISWQGVVGFLAADYVEVLLAAVLIRNVLGRPPWFHTLRSMFVFLVLVALSVIVAAFPAAWLTAQGAGNGYWVRWQRWAAADTLTHITFTVFFLKLCLAKPAYSRGKRYGHLLEVALVLLAVPLVTWLAFAPQHGLWKTLPAVRYLPLPLLVWAALRHRLQHSLLAMFLFTLCTVWISAHSSGPFPGLSSAANLVNLQIFLIISLFPLLLLAALIEEKRATALELHSSGEKYRLLVENQSDLVIKLDQERRLMFVSPSYCEIRDGHEDTLLGQPFLETIHEAERAGMVRALEQISRPPHKSYIEVRSRTVGGWKWLAWVLSAILDSENRVRAVVCVGRDIHERKLAEHALLQSEDRYRNLVELSPIPIFVLADGKYLYLNPEAVRLHGASSQLELVNKPMLEYVHPDSRPGVAAVLEQMAAGGEARCRLEWTMERPDNSLLELEMTIMPIRYTGLAASIAICVDQTERKRTEAEKLALMEQLSRSRKMEALGLLAGGVAHDLNNILSGILTYPELLLQKLDAGSNLRPPLETIRDSGYRAAAVVQDLVTISRGVASAREQADLNTLVREHCRSAEHREILQRFPAQHLEMELSSEPLPIHCSPVHVKKALMNLVTNAMEAMQQGGVVRIMSSRVHLNTPLKGYQTVPPGPYGVLRVADTGPGIRTEDLQRIFEPFYTKKVMGRSGTGLGLTIVWNCMQDHSGYINVESSSRGTCFELFFPLSRSQVVDDTPAIGKERIRGRGEQLLVVDDEPLQREIAERMLQSMGYQVASVAGGKEALRHLRSHRVDLVVLDMIMPGMDGLETYRRMVDLQPGIKAVITSGYSETEEVHQARSLGAGAYVRKPYTMDEIGLAIRETLDTV